MEVIPYTREGIYERDGGKCQICGRAIPLTEAHVDHIIPLAAGGVDSADNVRLTCADCNLARPRGAGGWKETGRKSRLQSHRERRYNQVRRDEKAGKAKT